MTVKLALPAAPPRAAVLQSLVSAGRFALGEFGPLIAFWLVNWRFGIKAAIAVSLIVIVGESLWRWRRGEGFTRLYVVISGLTLAFGAVDLVAVSPFLLKYEAVATNLVVAAAFVFGAFGKKPMMQEVAEQRPGEPIPDTPSVRRFFQIFSFAWSFYFVAKAAFYGWAAWRLPLAEAMLLRSVVGGLSLGLMIAVSATQGRRLFFLCRRLGLLPQPSEETAP
jgi:intracellular septation protein A